MPRPLEYDLETAFTGFMQAMFGPMLPQLGPAQVNEMKKCFFAGATTLLVMLDSSTDHMSDGEATALIRDLHMQLIEFADALPSNGDTPEFTNHEWLRPN
jgi:hypothetical protein